MSFVALKIPGSELLQSVKEAYERGLTRDALRRAQEFAPLAHWGGVAGSILAARLAGNCGAPRLCARMAVRAWKLDPKHPEALAQYGYEILSQRGPLALWQWTRACEPAEAAEGRTPEWTDWLGMKSRMAADLRDFAAAEQFLSKAEALQSERAWVRLQRSHLLETQDRVEESLEFARAACALHPHPHYRPGVQTVAHLLQLLDRDDEAIALLQTADAALQNGPVSGQLYSLLSENDRWTEADAALERFATLSELLDAPGRRWLTAQRARVAYHLGRREAAAGLAAELDDEFHRDFAAKLAQAPHTKDRLELDVTFVRQHFKTCAPATLAALGRFWKLPSEHLKLAEAMCYDGTPHWQQRQWAEKNGWYVREFRVTQESALALIERGVPFAISTVDATSAHMMAVIGCDQVRGTLLLRDPGQPYVVEVHAQDFLKRFRPFGPHGMAFVPDAERGRLEGLELPEAALQDEYHLFWVALAAHDRPGAAERLRRLEALAPDEAVTWETRLDLATYDANTSEQARCLDRLLELFPGNAARLLRRFNCLADAPREERVQFIEAACRAQRDPALAIALARALLGDARRHADARAWLKFALRYRPMDTSAMSALADLRWEEGALEEATALYQFAANLESFREHLYQTWFVCCRRTRRTTQALAHLQDRFARFGTRSEQPALTLAWAWREMEEPARAREALHEAIRLRPDDGYLLLRAATLLTSLGEIEQGRKRLDQAKGRVRENDWLRATAELAETRLDFAESQRWAREILQREPLAIDAHLGVMRSLARREGLAAARTHVQRASAEYPHHYGLRRLVVEWSRDAGPQATSDAAQELIRLDPSDAWAHRELALALSQLNRNEEALEVAHKSLRIEPRNTVSHSILGYVHRGRGDVAGARTAFRQAVELSVDNSDAITALLELARSDAERREELALIERELIRQVVSGDGLLTYLELARPILDPESLLRSLQQAHRERPDLWHAWSALTSHLGTLGRLGEALNLVKQAVDRFRHLPAIWLDLARIHRWRNEGDEELAAARTAFEMNPAWNQGVFTLATAYERRNLLLEASQVYERGLQHAAHDAPLHAFLANLRWRQRQSDAAFQGIEQSLRLAPAYEFAWNLYFDWSAQSGQPGRTGEFARLLTRERAGDARVWLVLTRVLNDPAAAPERLAAVNRALELDPRSTEAWDLKADLLASIERFDEAVQVCTDGIAACTLEVHVLRGRHAWIEAQRHRRPEAIRLMREVLAENVSYVWGWHQLSQWLIEENTLAEATSALEQLQRLRPYDAWVNRQLGMLRLKQENFTGARSAFAAALKTAPTDSAAAHCLLDLQLRDDLKAAAETLQVMQVHQPGAATLAAEVKVQLQQQPDHIPTESLEALCRSQDQDSWAVDVATEAMQRAGQGADLLRVFKRAIRAGPFNLQIPAATIRLLLSRERAFAAAWLFLRLKPGAARQRAASVLVHGLAQQRQEFILRWLLWRRRAALAEDDMAWGQVGFALSQFNLMKQVALWLADWRQRQVVQPWMLFNLCLALRHLGRYDEATEVARHVVSTWGHREGSADMRLFIALEDALAGNTRSAREHLRLVEARPDVPYDQQLILLSRTLVEFQDTPPAERRKKFWTARSELARRFGAFTLVSASRDIRRSFARTGLALSQHGAGPAAWLWFRWNLQWQWLLPLLPLLLAWLMRVA